MFVFCRIHCRFPPPKAFVSMDALLANGLVAGRASCLWSCRRDRPCSDVVPVKDTVKVSVTVCWVGQPGRSIRCNSRPYRAKFAAFFRGPRVGRMADLCSDMLGAS